MIILIFIILSILVCGFIRGVHLMNNPTGVTGSNSEHSTIIPEICNHHKDNDTRRCTPIDSTYRGCKIVFHDEDNMYHITGPLGQFWGVCRTIEIARSCIDVCLSYVENEKRK